MKNKPFITMILIALPVLALALGLPPLLAALLLIPLFGLIRPRLNWRLTMLALLCLMPFLASAATSTASPASSSSSPSWLSALIPVLVPIGIAGLKLVLPKLPSWTLPTIVAPVLGTLADLAMHYAGVPTLGPAWGAILGSAGVGLREIQDQVKQQLASPSTGQ